MKYFSIESDFHVHEEHTHETNVGIRGLDGEMKKVLEKMGILFNKRFTPEEDKIIMENWKKFAQVNIK
jgi:hypothetical protein